MKSRMTSIVGCIALMACACFAQPIPGADEFILSAFRPGRVQLLTGVLF